MKTVTLRVEDNIYTLLKKAAEGERRSISNFIENASLSYLTNEIYISDSEMNAIMADKKLVASLRKGLEEVKNRKYTVVK